MTKVLLGNIKGPPGKQGEPGAKGDPGDLTHIGNLQDIADAVEVKITDIPDLTLLFENSLI